MRASLAGEAAQATREPPAYARFLLGGAGSDTQYGMDGNDIVYGNKARISSTAIEAAILFSAGRRPTRFWAGRAATSCTGTGHGRPPLAQHGGYPPIPLKNSDQPR